MSDDSAGTQHRAAVLGSPIGHSLSPTLYRAAFAADGLADWSFDAIDCDGDRLPEVVGSTDAQWVGFAVTMPGKAAAAAFADSRSARVDVLGVANTLLRRGDAWHAENTDVDGVIGSLTAAGIEPRGAVLLLGGGGTARAVVAGLAEMHWDGPLIVAGRRPESTTVVASLAERLGLTVRRICMTLPEIEAAAADASLAVSTVPAGAPDPFVESLAHVPALFDVIYHPWPTPLAAGGAPGRVTVTGLDMLLHQALRQYRLVTGRPAPGSAMRSALKAATGSDLALPMR